MYRPTFFTCRECRKVVAGLVLGHKMRVLTLVSILVIFAWSPTPMGESGLRDPMSPASYYGQAESDMSRYSTLLSDYRVLCTAPNHMLRWGSFNVRCGELARHFHAIAPYVEFVVDRTGEMTNQSFNATITVKGFRKQYPPTYGHVVVDVVDATLNVPNHFFMIVLNRYSPFLKLSDGRDPGTVFEIEHAYSAAASHIATKFNFLSRYFPYSYSDSTTPLRAIVMWLPGKATRNAFRDTYGDENEWCEGVRVYHFNKGESRVKREATRMNVHLELDPFSVESRGV
mmetsp:Transcript_13667/g.59631  ORF Transcript_13667/g.59631 Transcript_13667/m.59631 type:complete len:285 (-) Transcript_13667:748-1602(-)